MHCCNVLQVVLCTTQPSAQVVASLPISNATGIEWGMRQIYISTPTHIYAAFVTLPSTEDAHAPPIHVQLHTVASLSAPQPGAELIPSNNPLAQAASGGSPAPLPRPPGPLALLGPRDGYLWVLNTHGRAIALPLARHPGFRVMCMMAGGQTLEAVEVHPAVTPVGLLLLTI
jgi:hypothetical protein